LVLHRREKNKVSLKVLTQSGKTEISVGIEDEAGCSTCPGDSASVCLCLFFF